MRWETEGRVGNLTVFLNEHEGISDIHVKFVALLGLRNQITIILQKEEEKKGKSEATLTVLGHSRKCVGAVD